MTQANGNEGGILVNQVGGVQEIAVSPEVTFLRGPQGERGEAGAAGPRGERGADGVSVSHEWDGTTLRVTSASGTSSADLKGERGEKGERGPSGASGNDGVGITSIQQTKYAGASGGENEITVELTTGEKKTFTVKNGKDGNDGVGVASIMQTTESTMGGGENEITATLTDGRKSVFSVYNGKDGVGISRVDQTRTTADSGGENVVTVYLTNGKSFNFSVYNGKKGDPGSGGGVSSWNDLTDKPFYEESGKVEVLAECQPSWSSDWEAYAITEGAPALVAGEAYVINWNGVEYECVAQDLSAMMPGTVACGDLNAFGVPIGNGEPFMIMFTNGELVIAPLDETADPTISIYQNGTIVHTLDPKYLPDGIPYAEPFSDVILDTLTIPSAAKSRLTANVGNITVGVVYNVVIDGTTYPCVAKASEFGVLFDEYYNDSGELAYAPFSVEVVSDMFAQALGYNVSVTLSDEIVSSGSEHTLSIEGGVKLNPISPMLLPPDQHPVYVVDFEYDPVTESYTTTETESSIRKAQDLGLLIIGRKTKINDVLCGLAQRGAVSSVLRFAFTKRESGRRDASRVKYFIEETEILTFSSETGEIKSETYSYETIDDELLLSSPNGTVYRVTVSDDGSFSVGNSDLATKSYVEELLGVVADGSY